MLRIALALAISLTLSACGKDMASDTYTQSATSGKVLQGTIVSARAVKIKGHDTLGENTMGGLAGGAGGAIAGSSIGQANGSLGAAVGGAVIGAIAGALVEDAVSTSDGTEYLVKLDPRYARNADSRTSKHIRESTKASVADDLKLSIDTNLQTDIVSVVQKDDPALAEGSRVYVVYHDDRPRLVPIKETSKKDTSNLIPRNQ